MGTHILGLRQMLSYIYCYFTDWYAYTLYGKCFHIYTATLIILGTANAFI